MAYKIVVWINKIVGVRQSVLFIDDQFHARRLEFFETEGEAESVSHDDSDVLGTKVASLSL